MKNELDLEEGSPWEVGPSMIQAREYHGCTLTSIGDETVLVVAGGRDENETPLSSVEFYFFNSQTWVAGPDLPKGPIIYLLLWSRYNQSYFIYCMTKSNISMTLANQPK